MLIECQLLEKVILKFSLILKLIKIFKEKIQNIVEAFNHFLDKYIPSLYDLLLNLSLFALIAFAILIMLSLSVAFFHFSKRQKLESPTKPIKLKLQYPNKILTNQQSNDSKNINQDFYAIV